LANTFWEKRRVILRLLERFPDASWRGNGGKMNRYFWLLDHPAVLLALVASAILAFAWPMRDVISCVLAALMMVVAAGITIRALP
jgi:hypothetical protein